MRMLIMEVRVRRGRGLILNERSGPSALEDARADFRQTFGAPLPHPLRGDADSGDHVLVLQVSQGRFGPLMATWESSRDHFSHTGELLMTRLRAIWGQLGAPLVSQKQSILVGVCFGRAFKTTAKPPCR